ncbi:MAG: DUF2141 domain-containing protein [Gammaproteobacteria bacterium]|nr:MAG: DUF2141 domain-containing protein [Gammaproteobacteria bacterium]RKZ43632.1 MAG: DUF2141 domain-containing protein [Gammaproteobacteria bacterium]RKZ77247.1 MAG: DUF2141 domain-containing protein [Gammaproteobacteria bacterium]
MKQAIILAFLLGIGEVSIASTVTVVINGVEVNKGNIRIGLFDNPAEFPHGEPKMGETVASSLPSLKVHFTDLPHGNYAIALFQDANSNEILDKNFLGIPKEKYGFSGKKGFFGPPDFVDAVFTLKTDEQEVLIDID